MRYTSLRSQRSGKFIDEEPSRVLERRFPRPWRPVACISRATRWRDQCTPIARSSRYTLGELYRSLPLSCTVSMCARSCASSSTHFCRPIATDGPALGHTCRPTAHLESELGTLGVHKRINHVASLVNQTAAAFKMERS